MAPISKHMGIRSFEQTQAALTESLREHLISDVPIGVLLSAVSILSLLVAFLAKCLGKMWRLSLFHSQSRL